MACLSVLYKHDYYYKYKVANSGYGVLGRSGYSLPAGRVSDGLELDRLGLCIGHRGGG